MEPFHQTVRLWVICCSKVGFYPPSAHQLGPDGGRELRAIVGGDGRWDSVVGDYALGKSVGDCSGCDVSDRNCNRPTGEPVYRREEVRVAVGVGHRDKVYIPVIETLCGYKEITNWLYRISSHLRSLTFEALASPFAYILLHGWPYKFGGDGLVCAMNAGVPEIVHYFKHALSP